MKKLNVHFIYNLIFQAKKLPVSLLDDTWVKQCPPYLDETSKLLRKMHKLWLVSVLSEAYLACDIHHATLMVTEPPLS